MKQSLVLHTALLLTALPAAAAEKPNILPGNAAMIIPTDRATLPSIMQQAGYATGIVGKWHLGLGLGGDWIDWNGEIKPGPRETGFGYSFIMAATGDRAPCVYIENQRIVGLDPADPLSASYGKPFPGEPTGNSERDQLKMDWSYVLEHSNKVAIRDGRWKFIPATARDAQPTTAKRGPKGGDALYDLTQDPAEATNVAGQHPDVVEKLSKELDQLHERGRSRP
jgi:arylsulfatase A-like enzyme